MAYILKIMNMSSGTSILVKSDSLTKYGWNKTMNWETTLVVGRMDPIQNFRNTESKIDIGIEAKDIKIFDQQYFSQDDFDNLEMILKDKEKKDLVQNVNIDLYSNEFFRGFFYPSYLENNGSYSMLTAPIFRCHLYFGNGKEDQTYFKGFATIPSFQYSKNKYVNENGLPYNIGLDFTLNVIHVNIKSVSSKIVPATDILGGP